MDLRSRACGHGARSDRLCGLGGPLPGFPLGGRNPLCAEPREPGEWGSFGRGQMVALPTAGALSLRPPPPGVGDPSQAHRPRRSSRSIRAAAGRSRTPVPEQRPVVGWPGWPLPQGGVTCRSRRLWCGAPHGGAECGVVWEHASPPGSRRRGLDWCAQARSVAHARELDSTGAGSRVCEDARRPSAVRQSRGPNRRRGLGTRAPACAGPPTKDSCPAGQPPRGVLRPGADPTTCCPGSPLDRCARERPCGLEVSPPTLSARGHRTAETPVSPLDDSPAAGGEVVVEGPSGGGVGGIVGELAPQGGFVVVAH